jgi:hypothetical protein
MTHTPEEMQFFAFYDGHEEQFIDPLRALVKLMDVLGQDGEKLIGLIDAEIPAGDESDPTTLEKVTALLVQKGHASVELADKAMPIFGLKPVSRGPDGKPQGTTTERTLAILAEFMQFTADLKKNTSGKPTSAPKGQVESLDLSIIPPKSASG